MSANAQKTVGNGMEMPLSEYFIGHNEANQRIARYRLRKHKLLTEDLEKKGCDRGETKYVWYPRSYFETLLNEMDYYKSKGVNVNGARVYLGEYENKDDENFPSGQIGLIIVLTEETENNITRDIILEEKAGYLERLRAAKESNIRLNIPGEENDRAFNVCGPCPPACMNQEDLYPDYDSVNTEML